MPASLEYKPLLMPFIMQEPAKPPKIALKSNAFLKIIANISPKRSAFRTKTTRETIT